MSRILVVKPPLFCPNSSMCEIMDCARNARTWEEIEDDSCFDPVPQEAHPLH